VQDAVRHSPDQLRKCGGRRTNIAFHPNRVLDKSRGSPQGAAYCGEPPGRAKQWL
jgi:hypothetical protein